LKDPTAVRAALTITISPDIGGAPWTLTIMRATRFSVILALARTACEPRVRLGYRFGCNFSRAKLQRFWLRFYNDFHAAGIGHGQGK
jgi:hypothetical protein